MIDDMPLFSINHLRRLWGNMCKYVVPFAAIPEQTRKEIEQFYIESALGILNNQEIAPEHLQPIKVEREE